MHPQLSAEIIKHSINFSNTNKTIYKNYLEITTGYGINIEHDKMGREYIKINRGALLEKLFLLSSIYVSGFPEFNCGMYKIQNKNNNPYEMFIADDYSWTFKFFIEIKNTEIYCECEYTNPFIKTKDYIHLMMTENNIEFPKKVVLVQKKI